VLAAVALFVTVSRELGPLAGQGTDPRLFAGVARGNVTVQSGAAVLLGAVTAAVLGNCWSSTAAPARPMSASSVWRPFSRWS
jgi:hypothetical protein